MRGKTVRNVAMDDKYKNAGELEAVIHAYFGSISRCVERLDEKGEAICNQNGEPAKFLEWLEPPTLSGLCLYLGIDKEELHKLEKNAETRAVIKYATQRLENYLERELFRQKQIQGIMFSLKSNYGWEDAEHIENDAEAMIAYPLDEKVKRMYSLACEFLKSFEESEIHLPIKEDPESFDEKENTRKAVKRKTRSVKIRRDQTKLKDIQKTDRS